MSTFDPGDRAVFLKDGSQHHGHTVEIIAPAPFWPGETEPRWQIRCPGTDGHRHDVEWISDEKYLHRTFAVGERVRLRNASELPPLATDLYERFGLEPGDIGTVTAYRSPRGEPDPCVDPVHACFECGHAWRTDADLIAHTFRVHIALDPAAEPRKVEEIHTCPCCAHDL